MPSEQRLHPATLLFELARHVRQFALPALAVAFGASRSGGAVWGASWMPDGLELWLPLLLVPAAIFSLVRYATFRFHFDERELVIRSGLLFRNERHIPFSRIQNVDAVQNPVHRLLGVIEVRIETGGGGEEEARLSVLPRTALDEIRSRVFVAPPIPDAGEAPAALDTPAAPATSAPLLHLPPRELLLYGVLENRGMVLIGAGAGVLWEFGALDRLWSRVVPSELFGRGFFRDLVRAVFDDGPLPLERLGLAAAGVLVLLLVVRVISMVWAVVRLYDFRLERVHEDLRTDYGLFTRVTATVPIRRVQAIHIQAGPLYRWLGRVSVSVDTAGGTGGAQSGNFESAGSARERLAPLMRETELPRLLEQVLPGFVLSGAGWQPVHPRAFRRAIKPWLIVIGTIALVSAPWSGLLEWTLITVAAAWSMVASRQYVKHLAWAEADDVVAMRSGWLLKRVTLARVNKIQVVTLHQSPFDRRAAMARVRVDTAGAGDMSQRVDVPFLDQQVAQGLAGRLSAAAANTAFRW